MPKVQKIAQSGHTGPRTQAIFGDGEELVTTSTYQIMSVTEWADYYFIFGHFQKYKFAQWHETFAKVGYKFCHY